MSPPEVQTTAHIIRVVKAMGVAPDASGISRLRIVGFRAHCHCGFLGEKQENYFNAARDSRIHVKASRA